MASATQITTGKVRFSYAYLFTPRASQDGGAAKYSVTLLIPKSDKATLAKINKAIEAAKANFIAKTWLPRCMTVTAPAITARTSVPSARAVTL